ncbi:hypothetical protein [Flavobacterium piscisymbiosum]|uniref:Uncharacterized protein n=1 Tax=Flavobacterium piscisymbiosum TaxID=2893753 RepID=A0ABS8M944_9FLAO|nr:hypothetical protein [Flavobacterium sp. F-30]MCC9062037.1 hypothetical protein [Flavobacterium sp. F-30]
MTLLLRWLLVPIIALIALLFWKGSPLLIKSALLIVPLVVIVSWFAHEGAFSGSGGLEKLYGILTIIAFLVCYEVGMLFNRFYLAKKSIETAQDDILLTIGAIILVLSIVYFFIIISK